MKVSTILLTTIFTGAVCFVFMTPAYHARSGRLPNRDRDCLGKSYTYSRSQNPVQNIAESALLKKLKARESNLKKQIREVENVLKKIEASKEYLLERIAGWNGENRFDAMQDPAMEKTLLAAAGDSRAMLMNQLKELQGDELEFRGYLEQCRTEQATLKVKIDLYGLSSKREDLEKFLSDSTKSSPIDKINETRTRRSARDSHRSW